MVPQAVLLTHCQEDGYGKHKGLVNGRYGGGTCQGSKSDRATKGVGIASVHLLHREIFVGFKSQSFDFATEIHPLFLRQVAMQISFRFCTQTSLHTPSAHPIDSTSDQKHNISSYHPEKQTKLWA